MSKNKESKEYNKHLSNVAKQTSINFIGRIVKLFISFITGILLARVLGPSLLGQYNLGNTIAKFTANFTKIGFDQGLVRFIPIYKTKNEYGKIRYLISMSFFISALLSIVIGSVFYFYSDFLAVSFFNDIEMSGVLKISAFLIFIFTYYRLSSSILKGIKRIDYLTIVINFIVPITFLLSLLILNKSDVFTVISIRMFSYVLGIIFIIYIIFNKEKFMNVDFKKINIKKYFGFSTPLLFIGLLYFLISHIDILMLGYFLESADVGIYSVAVRLSRMAVFLLSASNTIFGPTISELTEKKQLNNLKRLLKSITKIIFAFSFNFLLFVIVFNKEILTIFGEEYIIGGIVLITLTFGQFINASAGSTGIVLVMSGNEIYEVYNSIGICILNIILNIILIPIYGIEGAAIATATSIIFINIIKVFEVYNIFGIHPYKRSFIKIIIFAFITIGFLTLFKFININYIIKLISVILSSIVINFILIFNFALEKDDNFIINKIIKKLKIKL